jgi:N4-gp56 family major capsid protein
MAVTTYGVGDALSAKRFAKILAAEALIATEIAPLIGESAESIIHLKTEPKKEKGDQVTFGLRMQLTGDGVTENQTLEGNEESLTTYSDALVLTELAHAVRVKGENTIDNQRILFDTRKEAKAGLKDWYAKRLSISFFLHVCGYTGASYTHRGMTIDRTLPQYNLGNTVTAHTTNRRLWAAAGSGETNTADEGLESDDIFDLRLIDYAKELARTAAMPIRPVSIDGEEVFVAYLHPYQVTDLRTNTDTGQWMDFSKNFYNGRGKDNPIYSGAIGKYNGVILRESEDVTPGVNSSTSATISTVRRAVLLGAQAAAVGYGTNFSDGANSYKWVEKTFDYDRELGVSVQCLMGLTKTTFNSVDFAAITMSSYAAAHG